MKKNLFFTLTAAMLMYMGGVSAQTWEKTTLSDLTASDIFVIVDLNTATAMTNNNGTSSAPSATSVTISDDGTELTSTVADNLKWNVNPSGSYEDNDGNTQTGYTFYPNGSTDTWLYASNSSNNTVRVGTGTYNAWTEYTVDDYTGLCFVYSSSVTRYLGVYSSNSDWRVYTSVNTNINTTSMAYFKYNASGTAKSQTSLSFEKSSVEVGKSSSAQTVTNTVTLTDADGETIEDASITYSSSSETVTVSDDGTVTIPADSKYGTSATITATYSGDDSYYSSTATYTVTVVYEPGDGVVADELTYEQTGVTSSTYTDFTYTSSATGITYAGNVAGSNNTIQLNNSSSDKGLYSTSLYGKLVAVTAVFSSSTTSSRQLRVYGKSTPYSDASELYDSDTQGTQIGSLSNTAGTTTYAVLEVSDKYNYVGIRSYSGAIYLDKVTFYWEKTDDVAATIATSGVSTFSATTNMTIPDDVTAYQAAYSSGTTVTLTKLEGTVIPANTGVVVKGTASSNITFEATSDENSTDDFTNNGLIASSDESCPSSFTDNSEYYALTGGYWYLIDSSVTEVPANKAILYIKGGVTSSAPLDIVFADDTDMDAGSETTGITNATAASAQADGIYYNLQGMRVSNPASGLYIVGGKKVVVR